MAANAIGGDIWIGVDPALPTPNNGGGGSSSASGNAANVSSPATGYGAPGLTNGITLAISAGAIISTAAGLIVLYRQKHPSTS